ncbi:DUF2304 domain-containing protein [Lactovum odontotermitis]
MPFQLRILAIIIAVLFAGYIFFLVRRSRSDVLRQRKWIFLSLVMILGSVFSDFGWKVARLLGFTTYSTFTIYIIIVIILLFIFRMELSLIVAEKQVKELIQEVSILKEKVAESTGERAAEHKHSEKGGNSGRIKN